MTSNGESTVRNELAVARVAARAALDRFGVDRSRLRLLRHEHNTTFRVDTASSRFVLRINRPGVHTPDTIRSELEWLRALVDDTELGVPEPVAALDGSALVLAPYEPGAEARAAVLLRWQDGRFVDARLTPGHLRAVGVLLADLQRHARQWVRPADFVRPRVDTLTTPAKASSITSSAAAPRPQPTTEDCDACLALVDELLDTAATAVVQRAMPIIWATTATFEGHPGWSGLIHGDLHYENFLFRNGVARAIDFDDCGWGPYLYDLAVTLWELECRERYPELRDALLDGYSQHLPLPTDYDTHLKALIILRRIQILMWILESRRHAAFRDHWRTWAIDEINGIVGAYAT